MPLRLRAVPAFQWTGDVKQRLATPPSLARGFGRGFQRRAIRAAPMMVHVINQWHVRAVANRQQIFGRVNLVVILQRQARAHPLRQALDVRAQRAQGGGLVAIRTAAVDVYRIRADPFGDLRLVIQFGQRMFQRPWIRRVQHHELVGMKGKPQPMLAGKCATLPVACDDGAGHRQLLHRVASRRVCLDRKNLAIHPERADAMRRAVAER